MSGQNPAGQAPIVLDPDFLDEMQDLYWSDLDENEIEQAWDALTDKACAASMHASRQIERLERESKGLPPSPQDEKPPEGPQSRDSQLFQDIRKELRAYRFAEREVYEAKINICETCDQLTKITSADPPMLICQLCGCLMDLKARLADARCPMGKF